jgi:multicomponent Na+:H+ antiporter subunit B
VQGGADPWLEAAHGGRGGNIEALIINVLLTLMALLVLAMVVQRNLFSVVVLFGIYSFLMATVLVALDAVDVAMTEAAVGAGISTVLFLAALYLTRGDETRPLHRTWSALLVSIGVGGALVYGTLGLPAFSDPAAPIHTHVVPRYINDGPKETGVPNVVTAVLASYRGFDTLGETTVVFTAGIGVIALLRRRRRKEGDR